MDKVISNALKRRSALRSELAEIERFLQLYNQFKGLDASQPEFLTNGEAFPEEREENRVGSEAERQVPAPPSEPIKGLGRAELAPHIEAVIREAGKPLTRGVLLRKLDARGTPVGGEADRAKNMGTIMWRLKDRFVNLPGYGYWLRNEAYDAAQYDPSHIPDDGATQADHGALTPDFEQAQA